MSVSRGPFAKPALGEYRDPDRFGEIVRRVGKAEHDATAPPERGTPRHRFGLDVAAARRFRT